MITSFIIMFRETLEAALITGIILSFLTRTEQPKYKKIVYWGIAAGILASVLGALLFNVLADVIQGRDELIFEGIIMVVGALLLTTAIFWMARQKEFSQKIRMMVSRQVSEAKQLGLFLLVFVAILREGIESVIFLVSAQFLSSGGEITGGVLGLVFAMILGYLVYIGSSKINLRHFFNITGIILMLFAAGLFAHGIHEFQEAKVMPVLNGHIWDINPAVNEDGSFPLMHEKGYVGSILRSLFGYSGNPSLIEFISYVLYLLFLAGSWVYISRK